MDSTPPGQTAFALEALAAVFLSSWGSTFVVLLVDRQLRRSKARGSGTEDEEAIRNSTGILGYALGAIVLGPLVLPLYFAVSRSSRIIGFAIGLALLVACGFLVGAVSSGSAAAFQRTYGIPLW